MMQIETLMYTTPKGLIKTLTRPVATVNASIYGRDFKREGGSAQMLLSSKDSAIPCSANPNFKVCSVVSPTNEVTFCPRTLAYRAMQYCQNSSLVDKILVGSEIEFYSLDDLGDDTRQMFANDVLEVGLPLISHYDEDLPNQHEIVLGTTNAVTAADNIQLVKYISRRHSVSFLPRLTGYAGSIGLQLSFSLWKEGSVVPDTTKKSFIAGILSHVRALNMLCNPSTLSYKRMFKRGTQVFPVAYGNDNRTTAIRVVDDRIEVRFPDMTCNPYTAIAGLLMAGMEGVSASMTVDPVDVNLTSAVHADVLNSLWSTMSRSLPEAVDALLSDRYFLNLGGVFSHELLEKYAALLSKDHDNIHSEVFDSEIKLYERV